MSRITLVIGASSDPSRTSYQAVTRLKSAGEKVIALGIREGTIEGEKIRTGFPDLEGIDTISLYVGPANQPYWESYIYSLQPKRFIFNPGTENPEFRKNLEKKGIEVLDACTLVMLSVGNY